MNKNKPTSAYWIVAIIAVLWNIMGVLAYLGQAFITDEMKALMPPEQVSIMENTPAWITAAFAMATFAGLLGSLLLLFRKKLAIPILLISLITVLIQMGYSFFATNAIEVYGIGQGLIMPIVVIVIAIFLYWWSKLQATKGII